MTKKEISTRRKRVLILAKLCRNDQEALCTSERIGFRNSPPKLGGCPSESAGGVVPSSNSILNGTTPPSRGYGGNRLEFEFAPPVDVRHDVLARLDRSLQDLQGQRVGQKLLNRAF